MKMINKKFLRAIAAAALMFLAIPAGAEILIPGSGGNLPLSKISDLIQHVTGMGAGQLRLGKESVVMVRAHRSDDGKSIEVKPSLLTFFNDLSLRSADCEASSIPTSTVDADSWLAVPGLHSAVLSTTFTAVRDITGGKRVTRVDVSGVTHSILSEKTETTSDDYKFNMSITPTTSSTTNSSAPILARAAGITVDGFDGELVAEAYYNNSELSLVFTSVTKGDDGNPVFSNSFTSSWRSFTASKIGGQPYMPASIAVGDLNSDGYRNEVALITEDVSGVFLSIIQLSYANGSFSRTALIDNQQIYTHSNCMEQRRGDRNGLWAAPSVAAVDADFNNDGKGDELIAAYMADMDYGENAASIEAKVPGSIFGIPTAATYDWDGTAFLSKTKTVSPIDFL